MKDWTFTLEGVTIYFDWFMVRVGKDVSTKLHALIGLLTLVS